VTLSYFGHSNRLVCLLTYLLVYVTAATHSKQFHQVHQCSIDWESWYA